jgi:hypothetical protein
MYPLGYFGNSASSSVTSFDDDIFNSHHQEPTLQYPEQSWPSQTRPYDLAPLHSDPVYENDLTLHAPVPRARRVSSDPYIATHRHVSPVRQLTPLPRNIDIEDTSKPKFPQQPSLLDDYPQLMFPTPSELLHDLTAHDDAVAQARDETDLETKYESQRKARQRALAESIGFTPTDP